MLGYVRIEKSELKLREYEIYTGYYCGVCKSIGRRYGQLPRMALSYDAAFLALLLASVDNAGDVPHQEHCIGHRIKKKTVIRNAAIDYAADIMLLLAWYKLKDDAHDEGKLYARTTMLLYRSIFSDLKSHYPELCNDISQNLAALTSLEKERCNSLDMAAEAFSKIMETIFVYGAHHLYPSESYDDEFSTIGYHLGKWIYLMDAADDIEDNIRTGAYNPLLYRFEYDAASETAAQFRQRIGDSLSFNLYHYLAMLSNTITSLDIKKNQGIIENVIYLGLNRKTHEILEKGATDESIRSPGRS